MLYIEPTTNEMIQMLRNDQYANWSYEGAEALIEYLEQLADDTGEDIEFNVVELRCYYSEYSSWDELKADYRDHSEEYIRDYVIAEGEGYIITQQF
jgi:hypothetical protein